MFAEQRRLGNHSGARQAQPETVKNGEVVRQRPRRAGPSETCYLASEPATQGQQTQSDGRTQGTRRGDPFRPVAAGRNRAASRRSRERAGTAAPNRWFLRSPFLEDAMRIVDWYALRWRRLASVIEIRVRRDGPPYCRTPRTGSRHRMAHHGPVGAEDAIPPNSCSPTWNCSSSTRQNCRERRSPGRSKERCLSSPLATVTASPPPGQNLARLFLSRTARHTRIWRK